MTLVSRPEDFPALDTLYDRYFLEEERPVEAPPIEAGPPPSHDPEAPKMGEEEEGPTVASRWTGATEDEQPEGESALRIVASDAEVLRHKDFTELTPEERRQIMALVRRLALISPTRSSRRLRPSSRGKRFDLRRTLRRSLRTEGEPSRARCRRTRVR
jgi:uncharacterized protein with von Willebrand factor type A (vWA) domain